VLKRPIDELGQRPQPADILMLVEIADTTLAFDLSVKANL
jgi:hypothetical protein